MHGGTDKSEYTVMTGQSNSKAILAQILWLTSILVFVLGTSSALASEVQITRIYDGDTITLSTGEKIRLLQIDAPELLENECYATEAQKKLAKILNKNGKVRFDIDPNLDKVDFYGRSLRYLFVGKTNVNLRLVEIGAATPYFFKGKKGKYSDQLLKASKNAKSKKLGLWKKCPETNLNPYKSVSTGSSKINSEVSPNKFSNTKCDPNYSGCLPAYPPDLDCSDIVKMGLAPVRIIGKDVHKFDRDGDGIGCDK